jgi:branched-chain amino acid transport system substrate-binding protein
MSRCPLAVLAALIVAATVVACGDDDDAGAGDPAPASPVQVTGCSPIAYEGEGRPELLIGASTILRGQFADHGTQVSQALRMVLDDRDWHAGDYNVGLQVCNETTPAGDAPDPKLCRRTARAFARNPSVVVVVGQHFSGCAAAAIPILNAAAGGPVPQVSASATYLGLTREGPGVARGEPDRFYPTKTRSFARLVPPDDVSGAAAAIFAKDQGAGRVYALDDGLPYGFGLAEAFTAAARRIGLRAAGREQWNPKAHDYRGLADRVRESGAEAVYLGGYAFNNGGRLIKDLREALGPDAELIGPDGFNNLEALTEGAGAAADGFAPLIGVLPNNKLPDPGREFAERFDERWGSRPCCFSVHAAQAGRMMLDAIAATDGSRAEVLEHLFETPVDDSYVGNYRIDRYGDTTRTTMGVYRVKDGKLKFETAVTPPADLFARD